jgi:competence protein ComEC
MRKLLRFIPIPLTFFLALGILYGYFFTPEIQSVAIFLIVLMVLLKTLQIFSKKKLALRYVFSINAFALIFLAGALSYQMQHSNQLNLSNGVKLNAVLKIEKILKPSKYHHKYVARILQVDSTIANTKALLSISRDSLDDIYANGDILLANCRFKTLEKPKNPYAYDYENYLKNRQIYAILHIDNEKHIKLLGSDKTILSTVSKLRANIIKKLKINGFEKDELAIINALLLGEKQLISKDLKENYANAGAIHILAVSGLHIGILLFIFSFLLKPFEQLKYGKYFVPAFLIVLLWLYAALAGLSPSVVRAVAMFTALTLGIYAHRLTNTYNTLFISMFFLLLIYPSYLFEVGFQLSYLAVFFIVWLHPLLSSYWRPKSKILLFFWNLFLVSVCAQIGVGALSIFYFHQFPLLFFITNLVVLPFLGLILGFGVLVIVLSLSGLLPSFLSLSYQFIIKQLNHFVAMISGQQDFVAKAISLDVVSLLFIYCLIILFFKWLENKNYWRLFGVMTSLVALLSMNFYTKLENASKNELVIFHDSKKTMIGLKEGSSFSIYSKQVLDSFPNYISNYMIGLKLENPVEKHQLKSLFSVNNHQILVIDQHGFFASNLVNPNMLLLSNSPKINLERFLLKHKPEVVIADGTNYNSLKKRWLSTCEQHNIRFYDTSKEGAFRKDDLRSIEL